MRLSAMPPPPIPHRARRRAWPLDFVRGAAVTAVGLIVGGWLAGAVASRWPLPYETTVALILVGAAVHLGALLKGFGGWKGRRAVFLTGLVAGIVGVFTGLVAGIVGVYL